MHASEKQGNNKINRYFLYGAILWPTHSAVLGNTAAYGKTVIMNDVGAGSMA